MEEKFAGVEYRDKYRLRIYDTGQQWAKLERKRKNNNYVQKSSVIISREDAECFASGNTDVLLKYDYPAARSIFFDFKRKFLRPVVIIDYIRDAYMLDYNNIRITFDKRLRSSNTDLSLYDKSVLTEPLLSDDVVILEVKFNVCLPSWFTDAFHFESATVSAISKYCYGRSRAHLYYHA